MVMPSCVVCWFTKTNYRKQVIQMNKTQKLTRHSANYTASASFPPRKDNQIVSDFERGSNGAAVLMCLMFLVLVIGTVVFQW